MAQPPSGGCVLKRICRFLRAVAVGQPPSGGCVLKRHGLKKTLWNKDSAAFRRLCVETTSHYGRLPSAPSAAFRRLCVETSRGLSKEACHASQPPSGGCVLKPPCGCKN